MLDQLRWVQSWCKFRVSSDNRRPLCSREGGVSVSEWTRSPLEEITRPPSPRWSRDRHTGALDRHAATRERRQNPFKRYRRYNGSANRIVYEPGSLLVASIASRSETPSAPGFARRLAIDDVSPFVASEFVVTTMSAAAGPAAAGAARRTSRAPARTSFVRRVSHDAIFRRNREPAASPHRLASPGAR